jgi:hypothetical protein
VPKTAGDSENLDDTGGGDLDTDRDCALDVELDRLGRKLRTRLEENLRAKLRCRSGYRGGSLRRRRSSLAERYGCRSAASGIQWACAASDAELDALDCVRGVITPIHILAGGRSRTKTDNG